MSYPQRPRSLQSRLHGGGRSEKEKRRELRVSSLHSPSVEVLFRRSNLRRAIRATASLS